MNGRMLVVPLGLFLLSAPLSALAKPDHQPQSTRRFIEVKQCASKVSVQTQENQKKAIPYHLRKNPHKKGVEVVRNK